jgi:homoserine dehydrogenase
LTEQKDLLSKRAGREINLKVIAELKPQAAIERFGLDPKYFSNNSIDEILDDPDIDLVVETMGGKGDFVHDTCLNVLKRGKCLVTANKALLAERGADIFKEAADRKLQLGYEAAVCGAIPIIKGIKECFTGDIIQSISGIMNGTSNYILTQMATQGLDFGAALKLAQENGYAEADPSLDLNGGDASHKLILLLKLAFGLDVEVAILGAIGRAALPLGDDAGDGSEDLLLFGAEFGRVDLFDGGCAVGDLLAIDRADDHKDLFGGVKVLADRDDIQSIADGDVLRPFIGKEVLIR